MTLIQALLLGLISYALAGFIHGSLKLRALRKKNKRLRAELDALTAELDANLQWLEMMRELVTAIAWEASYQEHCAELRAGGIEPPERGAWALALLNNAYCFASPAIAQG